MAEKILNTRIQQKHDSAANWAKATNFKPLEGEFIIYDANSIHTVPRIKVGNGGTKVEELPFFFENFTEAEIINLLTNKIALSIDESGAIYNGGLGYKNGYRVRSGGTEQETQYGACTGYIEVKEGDIVRISGMPWFTGTSSANALNVANNSFTNIGQFTTGQNATYGIFTESTWAQYAASSVVEEQTGVWKWVVPPAESGIAYIRISAIDPSSATTGKDLVVTIN